MADKKDEKRSVVFRRIGGRIVPIAVGGAVAYSQREKILGQRTVYYGPKNRMSNFETQLRAAYAWKEKPTTETIAARFKALIEHQGLVPAKTPEAKSAAYWAKPGDRSGRVFMRSEAPKSAKPVLFVSSEYVDTFKSTYPKLDSQKIQMGEHEFQRKFVKEKSFTNLDDAYHRPLKHRWYKMQREAEITRDVLRHDLDIMGGIKSVVAKVKNEIFPERSFLDKPGRELFVFNEWKKKGLTPRARLLGMKSRVRYASEVLDPRSTSYEHAYFTTRKIKASKFVDSPRFRPPGVRWVNIAANPKRAALGFGAAIAAALGSWALLGRE